MDIKINNMIGSRLQLNRKRQSLPIARPELINRPEKLMNPLEIPGKRIRHAGPSLPIVGPVFIRLIAAGFLRSKTAHAPAPPSLAYA
jgi:hypothetical protein